MTRAAVCMLRLDFVGAWEQHSLVYLLLALYLWLGASYVVGRLTVSRQIVAGIVFASAAIIWWFVRLWRILAI